MTQKKNRKVRRDMCVIWICRACGAYNLDPIDWEHFDCINCGTRYYAQAMSEIEKTEL